MILVFMALTDLRCSQRNLIPFAFRNCESEIDLRRGSFSLRMQSLIQIAKGGRLFKEKWFAAFHFREQHILYQVPHKPVRKVLLGP